MRSSAEASSSYIPQDPGTALNPALRLRTPAGRDSSRRTGERDVQRGTRPGSARRSEEVALPSDDSFLRRYPHQLSGGQQQRVAIAMAFACRPHVIVCDEPTTGLDVTTQARVLETVRDLCRSHQVAALYVSHDLAVVAELADRVAVMYAGRIVESANPRRAVLVPAPSRTRRGCCAPSPTWPASVSCSGSRGRAPLPGHRPAGCFFAPRCTSLGTTAARRSRRSQTSARGHTVRCYRVAGRAGASGRRGGATAAARQGSDELVLDGGDAERQLRRPPDPVRHQPRPCTATNAWRSWASPGRARRRSPAASPGCTATGPATR